MFEMDFSRSIGWQLAVIPAPTAVNVSSVNSTSRESFFMLIFNLTYDPDDIAP